MSISTSALPACDNEVEEDLPHLLLVVKEKATRKPAVDSLPVQVRGSLTVSF